MPFSTGTARHSTELLNKINAHLIANSWTKLRGNTDLNCASPKSARYWRLVVLETQTITSSTRGLQLLNFRTTVGGANVATNAANFTISDIAVGSASLLISGGAVRSSNIGTSRAWWVTYDFGVPTTIREVYLRADTAVGSTPRSFVIQWSADNETWTTMFEVSNATIAANAYYTCSFPDAYLSPVHIASTAARRSGSFEDQIADFNWEDNGGRHFSNDYFVWQGNGYDASRRVFIHARSHSFPANNSEFIEFSFSSQYDALIRGWSGQVGAAGGSVYHLHGGGTITYWIYSNSKRLILVTKTGASDYCTTYIGFMSAFANPDYYPFPLVMSSTSVDRNAIYATTTNELSSMADPGFGCLFARYWDGSTKIGGNRIASVTDGFTVSGASSPFPFVWPHFFGKSGTNDRFPFNQGSGSPGTLYSNQTLMEKLSPTVQNDLPLIPAIIQDHGVGNLGALDGVFILPGGGIVSAEQALTISGVNYKIFPNRTRRLGASWLAVRED